MSNYQGIMDLIFASSYWSSSYWSAIHQIFDLTLPRLRARPCTIRFVDECQVGTLIRQNLVTSVDFEGQGHVSNRGIVHNGSHNLNTGQKVLSFWLCLE